jgi:hypothetical protein
MPERLSAAVHSAGVPLESRPKRREVKAMKTCTVDDSKRIRIPDAEPRQCLAIPIKGMAAF